MSKPATTPTKQIKAIAKNDFAYYLNGELVGYAPTYLQAQAALNDLVYNLLARDNASPADLAPDEAEAVLEGQQLVDAAWCAACGVTLVDGACPACAPIWAALAEEQAALPAAEVLGEGHSESASRYAWIDIRGWGWGAGSAPVVTRDAPATLPHLWGWRSANRRGAERGQRESGHAPMLPLFRDHDYGVLPDPCCPYFARAIPCPWPEDCPDCGPDNPTTTNPQTDTDGAELAALLEAETALRDHATFVAAPDSEAEAVCEWAAAMVRARIDCAGLFALYPALGDLAAHVRAPGWHDLPLDWRAGMALMTDDTAWLPFQERQHAA